MVVGLNDTCKTGIRPPSAMAPPVLGDQGLWAGSDVESGAEQVSGINQSRFSQGVRVVALSKERMGRVFIKICIGPR